MNCKYCGAECIKKGFQKKGIQKFYCKMCLKYQQNTYTYNACLGNSSYLIIRFLKLGCGVRDIANGLRISCGTVIHRIRSISTEMDMQKNFTSGKYYLVDELKTFVGNKENEYWVCCAMEKESRQIVAIKIGKRTKENLRDIIEPLLQTNPSGIYTDRLRIYKSLIPERIHVRNRYKINLLERRFLNFRTHLKRLARKSICYSKSEHMLEACIKIYLWQDDESELSGQSQVHL